MRQLLGIRQQAWQGISSPHSRLRLQSRVRAFNWKGFKDLKERIPSLDVVRERFPIQWPVLGEREKTGETEAQQQEPKPPGLSIREAVQQGKIGFGFSAGGLLFPYYAGVVESLGNMGVLTGDTPLAGASAGSLIAACHHCQLETSAVIDACLAIADNCRQGGTRGRLGKVLEDCLQELLPEDCHERLRGKAFISVTRAFPVARNELISEFENKDDVIEALMTSCHIPWWFDNTLMTRFRGALHYDGGLTNFIPLPPDLAVGIRVCCLPARQLNTVYAIDITPDAYEDWPYSASEMLSWAFEPADTEILYELIAKGRKDARAWALQTGAAEAAGGETAVRRAKGDMDRERYPALKR